MIRDLAPGYIVLAFDADAGKGRGPLPPRRAKRLYRNVTREWICMRLDEGGVITVRPMLPAKANLAA